MGTKIELTIRRAGGTVVEFPVWPSANMPDKHAPAAKYHFKPETKDPDAPHVAVVSNVVHVERLLSIPGYRLADGEAQEIARPGIANETAQPVAAEPKTVAAAAPTVKDPKEDPAVKEITLLPIRELKARINTFPIEALTAALALEQANDDPRKGFIEVLQAHLGSGTE